MQGVFQGFGVIAIVIALGYVLARRGIIDPPARVALSRVVFYAGIPALLFVTLSDADLATVFSAPLGAIAGAVIIAAGVYAALAHWVFKRNAGEATIGWLCSSYVNAGNLGIPIAVYVLGDGSYVAPAMLFQLIVLAPIAFAILDTTGGGRRPNWRSLVIRPFVNPVMLAVIVSVVVAGTGVPVPEVVYRPTELVAGLTIPAALMVYGASLHGAPRPGAGGNAVEVSTIAGIKLILQPLVAYLAGRFLLNLDDDWLLAVTVTSALPTAQNVFVYAIRYQRGIALARDSVFVTTLLSGVPILIIAIFLA